MVNESPTEGAPTEGYYLSDYDIFLETEEEMFEVFEMLDEPFDYIDMATGSKYMFNPWATKADQ